MPRPGRPFPRAGERDRGQGSLGGGGGGGRGGGGRRRGVQGGLRVEGAGAWRAAVGPARRRRPAHLKLRPDGGWGKGGGKGGGKEEGGAVGEARMVGAPIPCGGREDLGQWRRWRPYACIMRGWHREDLATSY